MGAMVYEEECRAAGLDPAQVGRIARRLDSAARDARKIGLIVFGGSGSGSLRHQADERNRRLIVADMSSGSWDGGDGGAVEIDGLLRGEGT